jgi:hypothetical protein
VTWGGARGHVGGARSALSEKVLTLDTSHAEIFALKADVTPLLPPHIEGGQKSLLICVTADTSQSAIGPYGVLGHTPPTGSTARHAATAAALLLFVMGVFWADTHPHVATHARTMAGKLMGFIVVSLGKRFCTGARVAGQVPCPVVMKESIDCGAAAPVLAHLHSSHAAGGCVAGCMMGCARCSYLDAARVSLGKRFCTGARVAGQVPRPVVMKESIDCGAAAPAAAPVPALVARSAWVRVGAWLAV